MMRKAAISAAFTFALASIAQAEEPAGYTAARLRGMCESNDEAVKTVCTSYLAGFTYGAFLFQPEGENKMVCFPKGYKAGGVRLVFLHHLTQHPEDAADEAQFVIAKALIHAFPCPPTGE